MQLLLVEGSDAAAKAFVDAAYLQSRITWQVRRVRDGYEGIDYLSGFNDFADRTHFPLPQMLVLRLSPRTANALDLLAWLRVKGKFRDLPVVVTTPPGGSTQEVSAYELAASASFIQTASSDEVLGWCEDLALNAYPTAPSTVFSPATAPSVYWPVAVS
jgi:hypothetical protein